MLRFNTFLLLLSFSLPIVATPISLLHDGSDFSVEDSTGVHPVQRAFMPKALRGISTADLSKILTAGLYLEVDQFKDSNDYFLKLNSRLNGGGQILGSIVWSVITIVGTPIMVTYRCIDEGINNPSQETSSIGKCVNIALAGLDGAVQVQSVAFFPTAIALTIPII